MQTLTEYLWFSTKEKTEFINITGEVESLVKKSRIKEGMCLISAMHITAGIFINDEEEGIKKDIKEWLNKLAPMERDYYHHRTGENNGGAHLRNLLIGHQQIVPVTNNRLDLGPWEQIFYAEFDGQRRKRIIIKIMGE